MSLFLPYLRSLRKSPILLAAWFLFGFSSAVFFVLTHEIVEEPVHHLDDLVLLSLRAPGDSAHSRGPEWLGRTMVDLTALGGTSVLALLCFLVLGYLLLEGKGRAAFLVLVSVGGGTLFCGLAKYLVGRPRPSLVPHLVHASGESYPSGHTLLSAVVYLTLAALLTRIVPTLRGRIYLLSAAVLLAFLVGLTRIYLGVHYPSDVIAGWSGGLAWALLCWLGAAALIPPQSFVPAEGKGD